MKYELEIRTTISPTPCFFRRIHHLAASLRTLRSRLITRLSRAWRAEEIHHVFHYLRKEIIDRDTDFASPESCPRQIALSDLLGSNELLRARLAELYDEVVEGEFL
jgi:hypothetical protein